MWELVIKSFYLALPAYLANMSPVIFDKLGLFKSLAQPIDGGKKIGTEFIFGRSKTWRGLLSGAIFGVVVTWIQAGLYSVTFFKSLSLVDYPRHFIAFGLLAGLGAILGDLIKSFFKRRFNIKSGSSWPVFDQLDFIAGFFIATYYLVGFDVGVVVVVFLITLILHPLTNLLAYQLGFKKVWW
ncbi:CDP-2,3-bis-(O-geranylgeranyl)-sn-glycerol synthase [Candidatus Falkowbacteria bacterium]|uniref:CDP-2,3-bis-(O-geranylgeranyl)-sn-glycerol synthase n=1 Tax=Candidatus Buchananbacteria bacterium CG10_big_fil_rev_8_21_14_0_10_33_19 TaxID=1974525 RepID=A0A2H0W3K0_9BACT|nr:CDP-2,3-bis-(O-geranylgeranyl)-sn-glycerol synthase [Candidatus Falkowbacteria bacterium]PIS05935.1 MAG: hypothetical protein COT80_04170 [Candidatus Buchananbacteria bacterium CG10_big_fil_rev_8_21_14_0_10_33_19]